MSNASGERCLESWKVNPAAYSNSNQKVDTRVFFWKEQVVFLRKKKKKSEFTFAPCGSIIKQKTFSNMNMDRIVQVPFLYFEEQIRVESSFRRLILKVMYSKISYTILEKVAPDIVFFLSERVIYLKRRSEKFLF